MLVREIFAADVTRDIAPVVYFHEQDPAKIQDEVSEYIITGGYPESDPRHQRIKFGIHEQFVRLLENIAAELQKKGGPELPASWISGFYGSGKSSFAKLLGLALDGLELPNCTILADALIARDDSPNAKEFRAAWDALSGRIDPIAVVFDVGAVARDDEHIHSAVKREVQSRLGYCTISHYVAETELKLELDGMWPEFEAKAKEILSKPWTEARKEQLAEEAFSEVMHAMSSDRYVDPMSWIDSRAGAQTGIGTSVSETCRDIGHMLEQRAKGKTLFLVVDEVSQYVHQNDSRMLKLQSFVSDLGQRLKGNVWLLATGQQKLEDTEDETSIGKLKDRFPPKLRVHLAATNIRDVVHKRLLKKDPGKEPELRTLFQKHRADLKLYGFGCESITEEDFIEVYPMLPRHVDLLMQITSNLRLRSSRVKGDDHAIRGLLQLLGELFREQDLGERELGELVTLDSIYEVQQSALDADIQNTLIRVFNHEAVMGDEMATRIAKVIALLELIQEQTPTTTELICQCLYSRLGMGNQDQTVKAALEVLKEAGLISYSEKLGYKIQSSAGQEWQRERDIHPVTGDEIAGVVGDKLKELIGTLERPRFKGKPFPWAALYSDGRQRRDERLQHPHDPAVVTVDFRYPGGKDEACQSEWIQQSDGEALRNRIIWTAGSLGSVPSIIRELVRSKYMVSRYQPRIATMLPDRQRLVFEEQSRCEELDKRVQAAVAELFVNGEIYYRGRAIDRQAHGTTFAPILQRIAESVLPDLYQHYVEIAVTPGELGQLLEANLSGPSPKFMTQGLGILDLDAGKYIPVCSGEVPRRILDHVKGQEGCSGAGLLGHFGGPPHGYPSDVIKACLVGLLRATKVRIRPEAGPIITSVRDPGAKDIFSGERPLKRADILPPAEGGITPRDQVAICKFFAELVNTDVERDNDHIADAVFQQFPNQVKRLQELEALFNRLPNRPDLPDALLKLRQALEDCKRSRQIEDTVQAIKKNLDVLRDGMQQLGILSTELTDDAVARVTVAGGALNNQVAQLVEVGELNDASDAAQSVTEHLQLERPWRDVASIAPQLQTITERYQEVRTELLDKQEKAAEEIRQRIKQRKGFEKLSGDQGHHVLRPITEALYNTTAEAVQPTLLHLRDSVRVRLQQAEHEANERLDNTLSEVTDKQVLKFPTKLRGREVSSKDEVEALLEELKERLLALLDGKDNVRVRLE